MELIVEQLKLLPGLPFPCSLSLSRSTFIGKHNTEGLKFNGMECGMAAGWALQRNGLIPFLAICHVLWPAKLLHDSLYFDFGEKVSLGIEREREREKVIRGWERKKPHNAIQSYYFLTTMFPCKYVCILVFLKNESALAKAIQRKQNGISGVLAAFLCFSSNTNCHDWTQNSIFISK